MPVASSRFGSDLLALQPQSFAVPSILGGDIGANVLAGVRADNGRVEEFDASVEYNGFLVSVREFEDDEGTVAHRGLEKDRALKLETTVKPDQSWLLSPVYATDSKTVSATEADGDGGSRPEVGMVVQVDENTGMVYVQV